ADRKALGVRPKAPACSLPSVLHRCPAWPDEIAEPAVEPHAQARFAAACAVARGGTCTRASALMAIMLAGAGGAQARFVFHGERVAHVSSPAFCSLHFRSEPIAEYCQRT